MKKSLFTAFILSCITAPILATASPTNPCLQNLDFHIYDEALYLINCKLTDDDIPFVVSFLADNPDITTLGLYNNDIGPKGAETLSTNTTLTQLVLSHNHLGDEGAQFIAKMSSLKSLMLDNNNVTSAGAASFAKNTAITFLDLDRNDVDDTAMNALASAQPNLTFVSLNWNHVTSDGAKILATSKYLTNISLSYNPVTHDGIQALANDHTLQFLEIKGDGVNDDDVMALTKNPNFTWLGLSDNQIHDEGAIALSKMTLEYLYLMRNPISPEGLKVLKESKTIGILYVDNSDAIKSHKPIVNKP